MNKWLGVLAAGLLMSLIAVRTVGSSYADAHQVSAGSPASADTVVTVNTVPVMSPLQPGPPSRAALLPASQYGYSIRWVVTSQWTLFFNHSTGDYGVSGGTTLMRGSAIVHFDPIGVPTASPFTLNTLDNFYELAANVPSLCFVGRSQETKTGLVVQFPGAYAGRPDANLNLVVDPLQHGDGSYYLPDPFTSDADLFAFLDAHPYSRIGIEVEDDPRCPRDYQKIGLYIDPIPVDTGRLGLPGTLEGGMTGARFTAETTNTYSDPYIGTGTTHWSVIAQRLGACAGHPGAIDDSDPIIANGQGRVELNGDGLNARIAPDGQSTFSVLATCDNVPVSNTEIQLIARAMRYSAPRLRGDPLPRGYINGTLLTDAQPIVRLRTDALGMAHVTFRPAQDVNLAGIEGIYLIKATSTRTPDSDVLGVIWAKPGSVLANQLPAQALPAVEAFPQPAGPDLVVRSNLDAVAMTLDRPISFTVQITNQGAAPAQSTLLTMTMPASVTLASTTPLTISAGSEVVWTLGDMAPGATQAITLDVLLDPRLVLVMPRDEFLDPQAVLTYTLRAGSNVADVAPGNNTEQTVTPVVLSGSAPAVWLGGQARDPGRLTSGQDITYTILYGNFGSSVSHTTTLTLSLSTGLSVVSAQPAPTRTLSDADFGGGVLGWDLGTLAIGDPHVIQVRAHVSAVPADGSLVLATIQSGDFDAYSMDEVALDIRRATSRNTYLPLVMRP